MELPRIMQTTTFLCSCTVCEIMGRTGRSRGRASPHPANDRHRVQRPQPKPTHTDASSPIGAQNAPAIRPHTRIQLTRPQRPPAATPTNAHHNNTKPPWRRPPAPKQCCPTTHKSNARSEIRTKQSALLPEGRVSHRPTPLQIRRPEHKHYFILLCVHRSLNARDTFRYIICWPPTCS